VANELKEANRSRHPLWCGCLVPEDRTKAEKSTPRDSGRRLVRARRAGEVRFLVVGVPGTMTEYFAEAGIEVPDEETPPSTEPRGPAELGDLPARHGITFFQS
jgi:hypothetical protein